MLTPEQKTAIDRHLRKENWLLNRDLIVELTDHYTEGVEERMANGTSFETAVREIHANFGGRKGLLHMEEEYQNQKYHQLELKEWRLVQSFMHGPRWFVSVLIFAGLFCLNRWFEHQSMVESVSYIALFYVSGSVIGNLLRGAILFYRSRNEINPAYLNSTSPLFIGLYTASFILLLANKYLFPTYNYYLSNNTVVLVNTLLETLCLVYYTAIAVAIKQLYLDSRNKRLTNAQ